MTRLRLLILSLVVATIVAVLHILATINFWYWKFPWFDVGMHFGGGLLIGLLAGGYAFGIFTKDGAHKHRLLFWTVIPVLIVGLLWEYFEYGVGLPTEGNYRLDTSLDLLNDLLGGVVAAVFLLACTWQKLKSEWKR